jgi:superfamily II RNA helicase
MTDMFEGSIIRSMRLLEELLRQMVQVRPVMLIIMVFRTFINNESL